MKYLSLYFFIFFFRRDGQWLAVSQRSLEAFIAKLVDAFRFQSQSLLKKYETLLSNERHVF